MATAALRASSVSPSVWEPQDLDDYVRRIINDPRYFLETYCSLRSDDGRFIPFIFNRPQNDLYEHVYRELAPNVWVRYIFDELHGKGRQFGDSSYQIGLMYHQWATGADFGPAFIGKVLAFADETAQQLMDNIVTVLHDSALDAIRDSLGVDPYTILPRGNTRNAHELSDSRRGCKLLVASERTKGQGRAATANWLYVTDLGEWTTYDDAIAGYAGSLSKTGHEVIVRDFTGKGPGNAAHREWTRLKVEAETNPQVMVRFIGVDDIDYPDGYLARQARIIGDPYQFQREYPSRPEHMFMAGPNTRFRPEAINACVARGPDRYLCETMTDAEIRRTCIPVYGLDTCEGTEDGDFAVAVVRDALTGNLIAPSLRGHWSPAELAVETQRYHQRWPGLICVERNKDGTAVILALGVLGLGRWLYRMLHVGSADEREGFHTNPLTRPILLMGYENALTATAINLLGDNLIMEVSIFGMQKNGKVEAPPGFHDDEVIADMLCVEAIPQAIARHASLASDASGLIVIGSQRDD